jgi:hypothetical protein
MIDDARTSTEALRATVTTLHSVERELAEQRRLMPPGFAAHAAAMTRKADGLKDQMEVATEAMTDLLAPGDDDAATIEAVCAEAAAVMGFSLELDTPAAPSTRLGRELPPGRATPGRAAVPAAATAHPGPGSGGDPDGDATTDAIFERLHRLRAPSHTPFT